MASQNGNGPVVELLLVKGKADPNTTIPDGRTALHVASQAGHLAVVKLLLQHGADRSARSNNGGTPADKARSVGQTAIVRLLGN